MEKCKKSKINIIMILLFIIMLALDLWSKHMAVVYLKNKTPFIIIDGVFQLRYLENRGAAWGIMNGQIAFFAVIAFLVFALFGYYYMVIPWEKKYLKLRLCILAIITGAAGNLIDRLVNHYVIDFFYFNLIDYPIFNVADIYVTVGTFFLIILILFCYKENELTFLQNFHKRKKEDES